MDVPLYYTLAYFGSGYSVLSFARRVSQVFQAVFSALFSSSPVSVSLQPLAGFPSASRPVQFAPTWWDPSHCFGKRRKKKKKFKGCVANKLVVPGSPAGTSNWLSLYSCPSLVNHIIGLEP